MIPFSRMDRIFLAVIVSGLLLAATSTALLVFSSSGHPMMAVTAVNLPASTDAQETWVPPPRVSADKLVPPAGVRGEQTRF
jgi:hypothetical protein